MPTSPLDPGFPIDDPPLVVPWGLTAHQLNELLRPHGLRQVTRGYHVLSCKSLGGLAHELGFHFDPSAGRHRYWLEFFRPSYPDLRQSYEEFQRHLESTFGQPTHTQSGDQGYPSHAWEVGQFIVHHSVYERFLLCEAVTIMPRRDARPNFWRRLAGWWDALRQPTRSL